MPAQFDGKSFSIEFTAEVSPEVMRTLTGQEAEQQPYVTRSVTYTRRVSGEPRRPQDRPGWRNFFRNKRERRAWQKRYDKWVADGKPDNEIRTYIPSARITAVVEE